MTAAAAPADLVITPRNMAFGRAQAPGRYWNGGDPASTAFYNALSMTFPKGEGFFIDSVKHYRDAVSGALADQVAAFIKQEAIHSREHSHFNRQVREAGYDTTAIEARFDANLADTRARPAFVNLTATLAFEHFTAILAHAWLSHDSHFGRAPDEVARLWRWHSMEEIEHKSVAFDTFNAVMKDVRPIKRWLLRSRVMWNVSRLFLVRRLADMRDLFRQDGIDTPRTWLKVAGFLLIYPGVLRQVFLPWLSFFRPGFHPWDQDDRDLLRRASERLGTDGMLEPQPAA